jgi:hypothetical protein
MGDAEGPGRSPISRRTFLRGVGLAGAAAAAAPLLDVGRAVAGPSLLRQPSLTAAPTPEQLHVQFGADASRQAAVSWAAADAVRRPRLRFGPLGEDLGEVVAAEERVYTEALTGQTVYTYHAHLQRLDPDTAYAFQAFHTGAPPVSGGFRTGPIGRSKPFRFTSFGDQSIPAAVGTGTGPWSPNAGYVVDAVEATNPLFHLVNGDLCYANLSDDPVATWSSFFNTNMRSASHRAWMPAAGNHENEVGNGPDGYRSYQTRFTLPDNGEPADWRGNWYTFTVGNIRVVSVNNDDVCLQDGGFSAFRRDHVPGYATNGDNPYIRGYSHGAQKAWLRHTLAHARDDEHIDWVVVLMHQVAMSSAHFNGADLGIRQEWMPLFDRYGVDLVLTGHEHHFERTFPVRGTLAQQPDLLTPAPQDDNPSIIDTTKGAVHMIIGGGGHPAYTPLADFDTPHDGVLITGVKPGSPQVQHTSITVTEPAPWSAYRDLTRPYGFATFDVDPRASGGTTTITVTHYGAGQFGELVASPVYAPLDQFTLVRPRRAGRRG